MVFAFFIAWRYTVITVLQRCATYLQPSGSDTPTGSERISRLPFFPFNPSQKNFLEHPRTLRLSTCVCQGGAREARDDRFFGEKKNFFGGHFHGTPQFLKPQILAETLQKKKKKNYTVSTAIFTHTKTGEKGGEFVSLYAYTKRGNVKCDSLTGQPAAQHWEKAVICPCGVPLRPCFVSRGNLRFVFDQFDLKGWLALRTSTQVERAGGGRVAINLMIRG